MPTLGQRLATLRKEKGLSQAELAKLLNMGQSTIAMYEKDRRRPDAETLRRLAEFFQVSVDFLLGLTEERQNPLYILSPEAQEAFSLLLRDPDITSSLRDPLFRELLKRVPNLTPEERKLLAQHWEWALRLMEKSNVEKRKKENSVDTGST